MILKEFLDIYTSNQPTILVNGAEMAHDHPLLNYCNNLEIEEIKMDDSRKLHLVLKIPVENKNINTTFNTTRRLHIV